MHCSWRCPCRWRQADTGDDCRRCLTEVPEVKSLDVTEVTAAETVYALLLLLSVSMEAG